MNRLKAVLHQGRGQEVVPLVSLAHALGGRDPERVAQLYRYGRANQHGFYGAWSACGGRQRLSPEVKLVAVVGSGPSRSSPPQAEW